MRKVTIDESPNRRPGKDGAGQLKFTEWMPPEIIKLAESLAELNFTAHGASGSPGITDGSRNHSQWRDPNPDPDGRRSRRREELEALLDHYLMDSKDIREALKMGLPISTTCTKCRKDLPPFSRFCNACGHRQWKPRKHHRQPVSV